MSRIVLTHERWIKIKPLLPKERGYWGRPSRPHRKILEGIIWILRTGAAWREGSTTQVWSLEHML